VARDTIDYVTVKFKNNDKFQMMISPRLGVSHPISDKDVLRFAYNYQNQLPQMQYIFTSKTSEDANSGNTTVVGNPALEPQITVTYEVGLSHQLSEDYVIDMTAYYKNLYNYVSTKKVYKPGETQVSWYEYISEDYGSTRGMDIQLQKNLSDFNTWSIAYSLAWAQGNNSSTVIQDTAVNLREFPLDWDVRHNVNVNYTFRIGRGEEFIVPFTNFILPLDDFSANMTWTIASGSPYTPTTGSQNNALDTNSKRKGLTQQANLRLTKGFVSKFGANFRLYMDVENLFKYPNIGSVFSKTGSYLYDGADLSEDGFTYAERQYMHNLAIRNPANVNNFRAVTIGVSVNF
jgi:outer membrane receptor protein involved in Fe transport